MAVSYDTLGSTVTVHPRGTVAPGQLNTAVAIVGGYDSSNAASGVTAGEATVVETGSEADNQFGADSELARQARLAFANGATAVHGVPVEETESTESFSSTTNGTLSNAPAMDSQLHGDEEITATNTNTASSVTVNIVYGTPSTPSDSDTMEVNPITGNWEADSSASYDITYTHGDYSSAITAAVQETVRAVGVCSEDSSHKTSVLTEANTQASNFRFMRTFVPSEIGISTGSTGSYTPDSDDWRQVEIAPAHGTAPDGRVRTVGAITGMAASQPIDVTGSITFDQVQGLDSLNVEFSPTQAENFSRVTAITDENEVAAGVTTSSDDAFSDIYAVEIIDFVVEQLYQRVKNYTGGSNAQSAKRRFKSRLKRALASFSAPQAAPPLLASGDGSQPYSVEVSEGTTDTEADVNVGIDVAPIAKEVVLDISVGPIQFSGASV